MRRFISNLQNLLPRQTSSVTHPAEDGVLPVEQRKRCIQLRDDSSVQNQDSVIERLRDVSRGLHCNNNKATYNSGKPVRDTEQRGIIQMISNRLLN